MFFSFTQEFAQRGKTTTVWCLMTEFLSLQSVDSLLQKIAAAKPLPGEELPLETALHRVLAEALSAPEDLPGFDRSGMDGYAVRARDSFGASEGAPALFECIGECPMGRETQLAIGPGQTVRIWTGGMLPEGADAVIMLEYSRQAGENLVELTRPASPLDNVICKGEDAQKGETILPAGRMLRPQEIGLLAALGRETVTVRQKPKIAVISSGDEIVPVGARPLPGQVRDINSYALTALAQAAGGEGRSFGIAGDDENDLAARLRQALAWADVLLLSGGSSAGRRDFTRKVFESLPTVEILAHGVAISPGKPLIMARNGEQFLWGLPGHAASALVCAEVFVRPLIHRLLGREKTEPDTAVVRAVLTRPVASAQGRRDYIRVRLVPPAEAGGLPFARPVLGKSGLITTLVEADALVICPEDREGLGEGQVVEAYLLL